MANSPMNTEVLDKAIIYAVKAHSNTERRGKGYPYIVHPLEALTIVTSITTDQEILAATVLHDVIEDTEVTYDDLRAEFGERIANLVQSESDTPIDGEEKKTWRQRKEEGLRRLAKATYEEKIVAMGDKLSNLRTIAADYELIGDALWSRFHAPNGKADLEWRYRAMAGCMFDLASTAPFHEYCLLLDKVFGIDNDLSTADPINIADYEESGDGFTATSYNHKNGRSMIKLYNDYLPIDVPIREIKTARAVFRMGIPSPMPGRVITDGKRFGAEFERILNKRSYARIISQEPDKLEFYAHRFAARCRHLHSIECNRTMFPSAQEEAMNAINKSQHFNEQEKEVMRNVVRNTPEAYTCIHGDMHIGNIITTGEQDYWIDLGDFSWGNPLYDLGMFYMVSHANSEELTMHLYHITNEQIKKVWDIFIRDYYQTTNDEEIAALEERIKPFAALRFVHFGTVHEMRPEMMRFIRHAFFGEAF